MFQFGLSQNRQNFSLGAARRQKTAPEVFFDENIDFQAVTICRQRMLFAICLFALVYMIIAARVFSVCLVNGIEFEKPKTVHEEIETIPLVAISRADILDRNGTIIATSLPTVNLYANPKKIRNPEEVAEKLASLFPEIEYETLLSKLSRKKTSFSMIKYNLSPAQQSEVNNLGIPALEFQKSEKRVYPHNNLFSHIIGYTTIDNIGSAGLEKSLHDRLTGSSKPLEISIDMGVQDTVREELSKAMEKYKAIGATAILTDVNSGEIISMVSLPDFDPNLSIPVGERALFNFATLGSYEPGSVFKTFNTALALESGKIKPSDKFDATKPLKIQRRTINDFHGENRFLTVGEILIYSSNIGSVQMVSKVGKKDQRRFLENLGFFEPMKQFELPEKGRPLFKKEKDWTDIVSATVSYGHGIAVTPLHVISAFGAIVNGGIYHEPTLLHNAQKESRRVISEKTSVKMRSLLRDVVIYGSGKKANVPGYQVAGKTGTADKNTGGKYVKGKRINSFLSTFPAFSPKYALLVVIDEPKPTPDSFGYATSGYNAVPTSAAIISAVAPQLGVQADFDVETQRRHIKASFSR